MLSTRNSLPRAGNTTARTAAREGFFLDASREIRRNFPHLVLIVTGGFRSREGVRRALEDAACDAVGFGRPAVKFPDLPSKIMFNNELPDEEARFDVEAAPPVPGWVASRIRSVGAGAESVSKCYSLLDYSILAADNGDIRNIMHLSCEASSTCTWHLHQMCFGQRSQLKQLQPNSTPLKQGPIQRNLPPSTG